MKVSGLFTVASWCTDVSTNASLQLDFPLMVRSIVVFESTGLVGAFDAFEEADAGLTDAVRKVGTTSMLPEKTNDVDLEDDTVE